MGKKEINIASCILTVNRKKISSICCVTQGFPANISVSDRSQFHSWTITFLSSCLHLQVSHLLSCKLQMELHLTHFNYTGSQFFQCLTLHLSGGAVKDWSPFHHDQHRRPRGRGAPQCHLCAFYVTSCLYFYIYIYMCVYLYESWACVLVPVGNTCSALMPTELGSIGLQQPLLCRATGLSCSDSIL